MADRQQLEQAVDALVADAALTPAERFRLVGKPLDGLMTWATATVGHAASEMMCLGQPGGGKLLAERAARAIAVLRELAIQALATNSEG